MYVPPSARTLKCMRSDPSGLLREALEPVLVPIGFQPGQEGEGQLIFCAGLETLSDAYPGLPQGWNRPTGVGACIDLVVDLSDSGIRGLDLEGRSLAAT